MAIATSAVPTTAPKLEGEEELLVTGSEAIAHALRLADVSGDGIELLVLGAQHADVIHIAQAGNLPEELQGVDRGRRPYYDRGVT